MEWTRWGRGTVGGRGGLRKRQPTNYSGGVSSRAQAGRIGWAAGDLHQNAYHGGAEQQRGRRRAQGDGHSGSRLGRRGAGHSDALLEVI